MNLVVDTNIIFSAILNTNSRIANILIETSIDFYSPTFLLTELVDHQVKLEKILKLTNQEILELKHLVTQRIHFVQEEQIAQNNWLNAIEITSPVDGDDIPFVALALELNCALWTGDKKLQRSISGVTILNTDQVFEISRS